MAITLPFFVLQTSKIAKKNAEDEGIRTPAGRAHENALY